MSAHAAFDGPRNLGISHVCGARLATFEHEGQRWVAMKPIVEGMGLGWASQFKKLKAGPRLNHCDITTVGADGRRREMACIPLRREMLSLTSIYGVERCGPLFERRSMASPNLDQGMVPFMEGVGWQRGRQEVRAP